MQINSLLCDWEKFNGWSIGVEDNKQRRNTWNCYEEVWNYFWRQDEMNNYYLLDQHPDLGINIQLVEICWDHYSYRGLIHD